MCNDVGGMSSAKMAQRTRWTRRAMSPLTLRCLAACLLVASCLFAFWIGSITSGKALSNGGLEISEGNLNFGVVWESESFAWPVSITNTSATDIEIREFTTSCGCAAVEPKGASIAAGTTSLFTLKLNLTVGHKPGQGSATRDFLVDIFPVTATNTGIVNAWKIRGSIRSLFTPDVRAVQFGTSLVEGQRYVARTILVTGHYDLNDIEVDTDDHVVTAKIVSDANLKNMFRVEVTPSKDLPPGPFTTDIVISAATTNESTRHASRIPVSGVISNDVFFWPEGAFFALRTLSTNAEETAVLATHSKRAYVVKAIENSTGDTLVEPMPNDDRNQSEKAYRVKQTFVREGFASTALVFVIRVDGERNDRRIPFLVTYHGVP